MRENQKSTGSSRKGRGFADVTFSVIQLFKKKVKVWFYIALYPVHWTAQSALHFPPPADLFIPTLFSASLGSILAMQQLRNDYSLTFPPLSIARYSFIQLSRLRRREVKENAQTSKRYQRGFEPGLSRLRVRHSTTEPPRSTKRLERQGTRLMPLWFMEKHLTPFQEK